DELFAGISTSGRVVFDRVVGGTQIDVYSVNVDGTGLVPLANTTDVEFFGATTSNDRVIFNRLPGSGAQGDLYSINADGTGGEIAIANSTDDEQLGGVF
ncbi:MAG: hypothetical protein PVI91_17635, partial [Gammaproteobacteria bacterium]